MRSIISDSIEALAFDLDGTLYDEYDFVRQAYRAVSQKMSLETDMDEKKIYEDLCRFWLEHGSSANVFQMAYDQQSDQPMPDQLLKSCVEEFRNADFELILSQRVSDFLDMVKDYPKVIITDGNSELQRKKYRSLGLDRWFKDDCIFVSGDYDKKHYKPDPYMGELAKQELHTDKILYFGDREIDRKFAENAGLDFVMVKNMTVV